MYERDGMAGECDSEEYMIGKGGGQQSNPYIGGMQSDNHKKHNRHLSHSAALRGCGVWGGSLGSGGEASLSYIGHRSLIVC